MKSIYQEAIQMRKYKDMDEIEEDNPVEDILSKRFPVTYEISYRDTCGKDEYDDDGFIHIIRRGIRYVFYNGQERGMFTGKDIPRFTKAVDKAIADSKKNKKR